MDTEQNPIRRLADLARMRRKGQPKVWAGNGEGGICAFCGRAIERRHVEYELDFGDGAPICLMHAHCFESWSGGQDSG